MVFHYLIEDVLEEVVNEVTVQTTLSRHGPQSLQFFLLAYRVNRIQSMHGLQLPHLAGDCKASGQGLHDLGIYLVNLTPQFG